MAEINWHDYELTHMIEPKVFMITSLFCLRQHFSVITSVILFKISTIAVSSVTTEPFIVLESITTCLKAIELFFRSLFVMIEH